VPFYVFDGRYAVYGAQPAEVFGEALDLARTAAASE
jgi:predicted DsbA family dithiol-disulfide isomerase